MPPVRAMSVPPQHHDEEKLFRPPPQTRLLVQETGAGGSPPRTPPRVPIEDLSPTQPFVPALPPPRFHVGTPERAASAPPKASAISRALATALREQGRGMPKKVRICDAGDGFANLADRVPAFLYSDGASDSPPPRDSAVAAGRPKN